MDDKFSFKKAEDGMLGDEMFEDKETLDASQNINPTEQSEEVLTQESESIYNNAENFPEETSETDEFSQNSEITVLNNEENTQLQTVKTNYNKKVKKKKGYLWVAIAAVAVNVALIASVFATGYFAGIGKFGSVMAQQAENKGEKSRNKKIDDIVSKRSDEKRVELTTAEVAELVGPAVVGIVTEVEYERSFWGGTQIGEASGSGIIFKSDGDTYYIITNNHVIEGAQKVTVLVAGDESFQGEIVGSDSKTDVAVVKIKSKKELTLAYFANSGDVRVGEKAIAIGNPLGMEFFGTVTQGIVSATNRQVDMGDGTVMNYIQTDAAINGGNSGGALVNTYGEVIGVNTAKLSDEAIEGMGFAIPISDAELIANDLIQYGKVKGRPYIGITTMDVSENVANRFKVPSGVMVYSVEPSSSAEAAGLAVGDIITEANGEKIKTQTELEVIKGKFKPGDTLKLKVYRDGKTMELSVILGEEK